ncbi:hypothetical protein [Clostridium sp. BJN0001]|uniref:hypothetical protein n=1 Tax=Clostridium sp. BJN0001 TaxID=2930219 RepID=UPI001FD21D3A|nr:hypothetical protein [Clostridium sp. BJN0001]
MPVFLILIGFFLIVYAGISINRDKKVSIKNNEKVKSFDKTLNESKNNISSDKFELGILRRDIGESFTELQMEIESIKKFINMPQNIKQDDKKDDNNDSGVISEIKFSSKSQKISKLIISGMSDDDICRKLKVDKGEVLLVKGLLKK